VELLPNVDPQRKKEPMVGILGKGRCLGSAPSDFRELEASELIIILV
jgi:hypothetical protein